jgi:hypothetical protein
MPNNIKLVKWKNIFNDTLPSDKAAIVMTEGDVDSQDLTDIKDALGLGDVVTLNTSSGGNGTADEGLVPLYDSAGSLVSTGLKIVSGENTTTITGRPEDSTIGIPEGDGEYIGLLRGYIDSTAADAAVSVGDVWWDTTLEKARVRLS